MILAAPAQKIVYPHFHGHTLYFFYQPVYVGRQVHFSPEELDIAGVKTGKRESHSFKRNGFLLFDSAITLFNHLFHPLLRPHLREQQHILYRNCVGKQPP